MMNTIKLERLNIEDDGYHIFIEAGINGKPARLLVDTGASRTVFDEARIKAFLGNKKRPFKKLDKLSTGLGTNSMKSHTFHLASFSLGETILENYQAVALNMEHVNQSYATLGYPPIDGVIGGDLLHRFKAVIDYRRKQLRWMSGPSE